jgi:hypothetical protein
MACAAFAEILNELPEDSQQLRPKHVGALINRYKVLSYKLVLNFMYVI